jgi:PurA ssDNA and RNA-binding protein
MAMAMVSGPAKLDRSRMVVDEGKLKSEVIFREDRRYYLDLKENHRGRFLKVSCLYKM